MLTLPLDSSLICPDVFAEHLILAAELDFALLSLSAISLRASIDAADDASYDAYIVTPDSLMVAALEASALTVMTLPQQCKHRLKQEPESRQRNRSLEVRLYGLYVER